MQLSEHLRFSSRSAQLIQVTVQLTDLDSGASAAAAALDQVQVQVLHISRSLSCSEMQVRAHAASVVEMEKRLYLVEKLASRIRYVDSEQDRARFQKGKPYQQSRRPLQVVGP